MSAVTEAIESYFTAADLTAADLPHVIAAVRHHFEVEVAPVDPALPTSRLPYYSDQDRFVVALVASYDVERDDLPTGPDDDEGGRGAARYALDLTRDDGCSGTQWWVYDRHTGQGRVVEQSDFDDTAHDVLPHLSVSR